MVSTELQDAALRAGRGQRPEAGRGEEPRRCVGGGAPRWLQVSSPAETYWRLETISCGAMPASRVDRTTERIQQSLRVRCERGCRRMCCVQIVKEPGRMAPR